MLAFPSDLGGHLNIWMAPVSGAKPVHLLSRGNDAWPGGWSPGGQRIAFMAKERRLGTIVTVPSAGGPVEEIAIPTNMEAKEPVWWTNGQGIYFSGREREDPCWHIWSLAFSDEQVQQLSDLWPPKIAEAAGRPHICHKYQVDQERIDRKTRPHADSGLIIDSHLRILVACRSILLLWTEYESDTRKKQ